MEHPDTVTLVAELKKDVEQLNETVSKLKEDTAEIINLFHNLTVGAMRGVRFLVALGKAVKWFAGLLGALAVIWTVVSAAKTGTPINLPHHNP